METIKKIENSRNVLERHIGFTDIFFMSFGGQAPFLSMLTYATAALLLALLFSPIVLIIGTMVVFINGLGVYYLSKKHDEEGGYFNYAYKSVSHRFGFETGWIYLFYSLLYAGGYMAGSVFVFTYVLSSFITIPPLISFAVIVIPTSTFLIMGIRPSSKYAVFSASVELIVLVAVIIAGLFGSHFAFYNPFIKIPSPSVVFLGILFAIGIPTGYGAVTPVSGEVRDAKKNIGKAALMVIIIGGLLESLVLYSLVDYGLTTHSFSSLITTSVPVITIMEHITGPISLPLLLFAAVNDGILGSLAFLTAFSRNLYSMSDRNLISKKISKLHAKTGTPTVSVLITIVASIIILVPALLLVNPFTVFFALGTIAGLANLIVHLTANFSLLKVNLERATRKLSEFSVGIAGIVVSGFIFIYSLLTSETYIIELVLGFIIIGFVIMELADTKNYMNNNATN